jgi:hypothetical protein
MTKTKRKPRRKPKSKPPGTIWEVSDALRERLLAILREFWPKKPTDRRTANISHEARKPLRQRCRFPGSAEHLTIPTYVPNFMNADLNSRHPDVSCGACQEPRLGERLFSPGHRG